jgi:hypothetical protein
MKKNYKKSCNNLKKKRGKKNKKYFFNSNSSKNITVRVSQQIIKIKRINFQALIKYCQKNIQTTEKIHKDQ